MKTLPILIAVAVALLASACGTDRGYEPRAGDIVFQTSRSPRSEAIQLATHSPYSHMGIVVVRDGRPFVFEAVGPVKLTPLHEWTARGADGRFVVKRLANADDLLTPGARKRLQEEGERFLGKPYDSGFAWSDERIYCSELVWKIYRNGLGIEVGRLEELGDLDLGSPVVQAQLHETWGDDPPLDETVVSPAAIFADEDLVEVYRGEAR